MGITVQVDYISDISHSSSGNGWIILWPERCRIPWLLMVAVLRLAHDGRTDQLSILHEYARPSVQAQG